MEERIIQVLENKDKARTRINVFHDSSLNWINLIKELVGNSLDIFNKDELHKISIELLNNKEIVYFDDGQGIPVEGVASNGQSNYIALFETDFAGSRYGNTGATIGQNGIFLWSLAMSCEYITFEIARPNGNVYSISYNKGDRVKDLHIIGKSSNTYTKISFKPDEEVWTNINYTFEEISSFVQGQSSLANVEIYLKDNLQNEATYKYNNGIVEYFIDKTKHKSIISNTILMKKETLQKASEKIFPVNIQLVLSFSNDSEEDFKKDYLNTADLIKYGTIREGIVNGLKTSINKYLKETNKYNKGEKQISSEDIDAGLNYVCDVRSPYVEYVGQSKQSTNSNNSKKYMTDTIISFFETYIVENPIEIEKIANQILINKRSREKANQARLNIQKKLSETTKGGLSRKIEGLKDCDMRHSTLEERIFLVDEGLSANSTIIEAFDNRYMGCMGLRGRFINSLKASVEDVLKNEPAMGIIKSLGCGIEIPYEERKQFKDIQTFDINNLRYGSIGILCDADSFGKGISLAILTFFKKFMPTLLRQGRIFFVVSPRYEVRNKKKVSFYAYDEKEKENIIKELGSEILDVSIRKGLGEFNKEEFWEYVLSPSARESTFIKVVYEGQAESIEYKFNSLMGEDIEGRKKFIKENIVNINLEEID